MKAVLLIILCFSFLSCPLFFNDDTTKEPSYTAQIAWDSGLISNSYKSQTVAGDSVFFYERPPGETSAMVYVLTRLDAKTGSLIWRSSEKFSGIIFCQPIVIGNTVYVFLGQNSIWCFDRESGKRTAIVEVDIENQKLRMEQQITSFAEHLYFCLFNEDIAYLVRLDTTKIIQTKEPVEQLLAPEILWIPETSGTVTAKPVVYNNVVYASTFGAGYAPVELVGININTKEKVFYQTFGGPLDGDVPAPEEGSWNNAIFIHDNVLYYLSWSIAAWDLNTGKQLYRHVFTWDTPNAETYSGCRLLQAVYYKGKIYYTNGSCESDQDFRSIHCIDAKTGKLVWNDVRSPYSLDSNVIITHDNLYVTQSTGLLVYEPETGKLLGIDKSLIITDLGLNLLYNDYLICVQLNPDKMEEGRMVAIYVGK